MADRFRIGGIRLSGELTQVDLQGAESPGKTLVDLLQNIGSARINISHLHTGRMNNGMQTALCVDSEDFRRLQASAVVQPTDRWCRIVPAVGTMAIYPHGSQLPLLAAVSASLVRSGIEIYGISSSVSALVIHTDYHRLDEAATVVLEVCQLPQNHTPLRPVVLLEGREVETAAVYWEPKIRIYGMDVSCALSLMQAESTGLAGLIDFLEQVGSHCRRFRFVNVVCGEGDRWSCTLLVDEPLREQLRSALQRFEPVGGSAGCTGISGDLVSFHGPHFQDRYGIAALTFAELQKSGVTVFGAGCTGTSVQILVGEGDGPAAARSLENVCEIPSRSS